MQKPLAHRSSRHIVDRRQLWRLRISNFLDSLPFTVFAVALTVLILFMDDFRTWLFPKSADPVFFAIALTILCLFSLEIIVSSLAKDDYFLRFFFFLDLLAAFSLIPDIPYIWDPILGVNTQDINPSNLSSVAAAAHASSSSSPANRVLKFVRLIRLVRIAKLFELCAKTKKQQIGGAVGGGQGVRKGHSQVGQHLSEQTTRKVVLLVLLMLFGIPLLQPQDSQQGEEYSLRELSLLSSSPSLTPSAWQDELNFTLSYYSSILYLNVSANNQFDYQYVDPALSNYRVSEILSVSSNNVMAFFSRRAEARMKGEYNIITTLVVLVLLAVGAVLFNRNNHRMVIVPIERMMATIVALQQNPLAKASLASQPPLTTREQPPISHKNSSTALTSEDVTNTLLSTSPSLPRPPSSLTPDQPNETGMLERTLEKLTGLLQVGFGEAGSKMIQKCMQLNAEGDLDPLVDGTKMLAIFGFCDIRRFTDATECFAEDTQVLGSVEGEYRWMAVDDVLECEKEGKEVLLASYNEETEGLEYRPMSGPVLVKHGKHCLIDFQRGDSRGSNGVALTVTAGHRMYAKQGGSDRYSTVAAQQLLDADIVHFLGHVKSGVSHAASSSGQAKPLPFSSTLELCTSDEEDAFLELYGHWLGDGSVDTRQHEPVVRLTAHSEAQVASLDALFARLARALSAGYTRMVHEEDDNEEEDDKSAACSVCDYSIHEARWCRYFAEQCARPTLSSYSDTDSDCESSSSSPSSDVTEIDSPSSRSQWPHAHSDHDESVTSLGWLLDTLDRDQLRLVLRGYTAANGYCGASMSCVHTPSARLRDELVTLCLHAGYSAHFDLTPAGSFSTLSGRKTNTSHDLWSVHYTDDDAFTHPTLLLHRDAVSRSFHGRVWCVTVPPHHLIVARKVHCMTDGVVTSASRPVIVGQCLKEDVMMYVNEIAAIVHSQVAALDGNPNKNIGDAFLLVWRLPQEMEVEDIAELQKLIGGGEKSARESPSPSHGGVLDWATPKGVGVIQRSRTNTNTVDTERDRERGESEGLVSQTKSQSFIQSRQNKPSILRHLTGSGFPFSSSPHALPSPTGGGAFDLKQALSFLPPRQLTPALRASVSALADKAVVSFIRVIVEINASEELKKYALNTRIKQVFDDFQVELGFGLHVGWAIEGPIGSRYKIDASYLSPHVNLAETLEGTTKVYGVPLLLSGEMYALLSPYMRAFCRKLDCVKVSGRETPIVLYTFDMQQKGMDAVCRGEQLLPLTTSNHMTEEKAPDPSPKLSQTLASTPLTMCPLPGRDFPPPSHYLSNLRAQFHLSPPTPPLPYHFVRQSVLSVLHQHIPVEFFDYHSAGVEAYLAGSWDQAKAYLTRAQEMVGGTDEPTRVILDFMVENHGVPPDTWQGYREL